jgi:hypothetical protein
MLHGATQANLPAMKLSDDPPQIKVLRRYDGGWQRARWNNYNDVASQPIGYRTI